MIFVAYGQLPRSTKKYGVSWDTTVYNGVLCGVTYKEYHEVPRSTAKYHGISWSIMMCQEIPFGTMKYLEVPRSTMKYHDETRFHTDFRTVSRSTSMFCNCFLHGLALRLTIVVVVVKCDNGHCSRLPSPFVFTFLPSYDVFPQNGLHQPNGKVKHFELMKPGGCVRSPKSSLFG